MVYLKAIQKITPVDVYLSGTIDQETYLNKFREGLQPPYPPWTRLCVPSLPVTGVVGIPGDGTSGGGNINVYLAWQFFIVLKIKFLKNFLLLLIYLTTILIQVVA